MRFSLLIKLALGFIVVLGIGLFPPYFYSSLFREQIWNEFKQNLALRTQAVAKRINALSTKELPTSEIVLLSELSGARVTIFFMDNQSWEDSSQTSQIDHSERLKEFQEALQNPKGYGADIRLNPLGEMSLYVAQFYSQPKSRTFLVRLSQPMKAFFENTITYQTIQRISLGISCSLALLFFTGFAIHLIRPMNRLKQKIQEFMEGDYSLLDLKQRRDEIGEVQTNLKKLVRYFQQEVVLRNLEEALSTELVRVLPFPVALLDVQLGVKQINPAFREAAQIDPATEHARFHILCKMPEFGEATVKAQQTRTPQTITVRLPWYRRKITIQVCPLPTKKGEVEWALIILDSYQLNTRSEKEFSRILNQSIEILNTLSQRDPSEYAAHPLILKARFLELRILSDLASMIRSEEHASDNVPIDFTLLLDSIHLELQPLLKESHLSISMNPPETKVEIIENQKRVEYVLRAAFLRALLATKASSDSSLLLVLLDVTETQVTCSWVGLPQPIFCEDLDRILAPFGGAAGPLSQEDSSSSHLLPEGGDAELWIKLRRA